MSLLVKGTVVSFEVKKMVPLPAPLHVRAVKERDEDETVHDRLVIFGVPDDWTLLHDPDGKFVNRCDAFVCPYRTNDSVQYPEDDYEETKARAYYGDEVRLTKKVMDIPQSGWQRVTHVHAVRYLRKGNLGAPYRHPFDGAVRLERSVLGGKVCGYRLVMPAGCIWTERGFVRP